jgi:hypothetical protein
MEWTGSNPFAPCPGVNPADMGAIRAMDGSKEHGLVVHQWAASSRSIFDSIISDPSLLGSRVSSSI